MFSFLLHFAYGSSDIYQYCSQIYSIICFCCLILHIVRIELFRSLTCMPIKWCTLAMVNISNGENQQWWTSAMVNISNGVHLQWCTLAMVNISNGEHKQCCILAMVNISNVYLCGTFILIGTVHDYVCILMFSVWVADLSSEACVQFLQSHALVFLAFNSVQ